MGILRSLLQRRSSFTADQEPPEWFLRVVGGLPTAAGVQVNEYNALRFAAVWNAVQIISQTVGMVSLITYARLPRGKRRAEEHPAYALWHDEPNPYMSALVFRETLQAHLLTWGNAYAELEFDERGQLVGVWPLRPDRVQVWILDERRPPSYVVTLRTGEQRGIPARFMLHIPGLGFDGLVGYSPIRMLRDAIGLGIAAQEFGARFFANDARPGIVLKHPGTLSEKARQNLQESWEKMHKGLERAHRVAILEEGLDIAQVGFPPEDAQFIATREFSIQDVARIFNLPPHLLKDLSRSTFSNIEHQGLEFVTYTMLPWFRRWEQEVNRKAFSAIERPRYFVEFLLASLLRGDMQSRYQAYAVGRQWGWLSANDVRELENLNPIQGGDIYMVPLNMVPAAQAAAPTPPQGARAAVPARWEERARRSAEGHRRIADAFGDAYLQLETRLVKRECGDVRREARKRLGRREQLDFDRWLGEYYEEHAQRLAEQRLPTNMALAEMAQADVAEEMGAEPGLGPELQRFVEEYTKSHAELHAFGHLGQLREVMAQAAQDGQDELEAVEARLQEWEEKEPAKRAEREPRQLSNAVVYTSYKLLGLLRLAWYAFPGACPYCSSLHGRTVDIEQPFLIPGVPLTVDGVDGALTVSHNLHHPPAHDGCKCTVVPA